MADVYGTSIVPRTKVITVNWYIHNAAFSLSFGMFKYSVIKYVPIASNTTTAIIQKITYMLSNILNVFWNWTTSPFPKS